MQTLEVLVPCMDQTDFSLAETMNLKCDAILANQCNTNSLEEHTESVHRILKISTATRGVGLNRNMALSYCSGDILLFSDDDVVYRNDYVEKILSAFDALPNADLILFGIDVVKGGVITTKKYAKTAQITRFQVPGCGTCRIAIRKSALLKKNLHFTHIFGGGCIYGAGEDSLFLLDCFRSKLKIYTAPYVLGKTFADQSTWFTGFTEKYFYDKGAFLMCAMPLLRHIYCWRFILFLKTENTLSWKQKLTAMYAGMSRFQSLLPYNIWKESQHR